MKALYRNSFFALIACVYSISVIAQTPVTSPKMPIDASSKLITYQEVVSIAGTKDQLFDKAIGWINSFYPNPTDVTKVRSKENGKIEGIARFKVYNIDKDKNKTDAGSISYSFSIDLKEGKFRYTLEKFNMKGTSYLACEKWVEKPTSATDSYLTQLDDYAKDLVKKLKESMAKTETKKNDNW